MKRTITIITTFVLIFLLSGNTLFAQNNADSDDQQGPALVIVSGFKGGSNYQMAKDIQRMTRKVLGKPKYETTTEMVTVLDEDGKPKLDDLGDPVEEEKTKTVATGDTVDFVQVLPSEGSYYNFLRVNKSGADIAFIQYDVLLYEAMKDLARTYKKAENIRILLPMGTEQIHIITLKSDGKKGIQSFADLKKKKVGIGSSLMGTNITAKYIKEVTKMKWQDVEIPFDKSFKALFNGTIDAFFYVGAKPVKDLANISPAMRNKITLIGIPENKELDKAYEKVQITPEDYKWLDKPVATYAVKSVLVTSLLGQTPEKENAIKKMLEVIKAHKDDSGNHPNWKSVTFAKDDKIDWQYYPAALKLY